MSHYIGGRHLEESIAMTAGNIRNTDLPHLSRRETLRLLAGSSAAALLAACGGGADRTATSAPQTAPTTVPATVGGQTGTPGASSASAAASPAAGSAAVSGSPGAASAIMIPNTGAKLPTEKVSFRWTDFGLDNRAFFPSFFAAYQKAHPNITVTYDNVTDGDAQKILTAGVQGGDAPDVFRGPSQVTGGQMVKEGWVAPLDDVIPNFDAWKKAFPPNSFFEGVNVFGGKTYSFPHIAPKSYGTLLYYNTDYMSHAGYDPQAKPLTWDEFRAAAKKITQLGNGQYYGYLLAGGVTDRWGIFVNGLARMVAPVGDGNIDWKTGEYAYTSAPYLAAIDLLLALKADGSVFPGSGSLNQQDAVGRMPTGVAGMFFSVSSNIPVWEKGSPDFKFDVASQPIPNSGNIIPLSVSPGGTFWWRYTKSKYPEITGDIFSYVGSAAGQITFQNVSGGGSRLSFPQSDTAPSVGSHARKAYALFDQQTRIGPDPSIRNPDVGQVRLEMRTLTPDFGTMVQGIYTGQLGDAKKAMQDLKDRSDKELDRAIKAAQTKGAKVSRNDYVFPNWDPTKDYTEADYAALKKG